MRYERDGDTEFQLDLLLNNGLIFFDNFNGAMLEVNMASGENIIQHGLGFIPIGYLVIYSENPAIFSGSSIELWTTEELLITSSAASPVVRLFVM